MKDFTATISEQSPRAEEWERVFGSREAILKSPFAHLGKFPPNDQIKQCYDLDLATLTPDQRGRLIQHISQKFDIPAEEVERDLDRIGMPILAEDVIVTIHNPLKWV